MLRPHDAITWERQEIILDAAGEHPEDAQTARHADVVVQDGWAALIYFTHRNTPADHTAEMATAHARRSVIHWARVWVENDELVCDRNVGTLHLTPSE